MKHIFEGKGVLKTKIEDAAAKAGNHIAFVKPIIPRNVDNQMSEIVQQLKSVES